LLTILAPDLKRDLGISDSDLGFLYGTVFGVFYALFGIPLGKLVDHVPRMRLLAFSLALWSLMTALSGLSRNFAQLSVARIGVGIGEASATPCAYSLVGDCFPPHRRATALGIYSAGLFIGGGLSLFLGSTIATWWEAEFPFVAPLNLAGWQAAFLIIGLPGIALAFGVAVMREPPRGCFEEFPDRRSMGHARPNFLLNCMGHHPTLYRAGCGSPRGAWAAHALGDGRSCRVRHDPAFRRDRRSGAVDGIRGRLLRSIELAVCVT